MAQNFFGRKNRRFQKDQSAWSLGLILVIAATSFALGYAVGGLYPTSITENDEQLPLPEAKIALPAATTLSEETKTPEKLTFYENLPKGDQAPLGSGINHPPASKQEKTEEPVQHLTKQTSSPKPADITASHNAVAQPPGQAGSFVVQVASFQNLQDAKKLETRLLKLDLPAFVERADLGNKGIWHRVLAGPYEDEKAAIQIAASLKNEQKLSALVRRK
ncbi:MAG: SPOR domain-containing protein [Deltaproteobacteria bacterium]|jgi:cell division septation protein DedD|nr:SPOR domain-containing protein [Deltaproteobacteria bacterium]